MAVKARLTTVCASPLQADARRRLIGKLHLLKAQARLDDDDYRDLLEEVTSKRSAADLSHTQLVAVVERLEARGAKTAFSVDGPYAGKLRALWITAWNLGIVRDRSDVAMTAFVNRQTGLEAIRWLRDPGPAAKAIEGLKSWIARDGGVDWSAEPDNPRAAVVAAQWDKLCAIGSAGRGYSRQTELVAYGTRVTGVTQPHWYSEEQWDAVIRALGRKLRFELGRRRDGADTF